MSASLPLIEWDERRQRWSVGEEAASVLAAHDAPLAVVAVAGRYRSGKSFLLSQLCGGGGGGGGAAAAFGVGHTVESHTRGIWMASSMVPARTAGGDAVDVLFLDSEGLGATDKVRGAARRAALPSAPPPRATSPAAVPLPMRAERATRHDGLFADGAAVLHAHLQRLVVD